MIKVTVGITAYNSSNYVRKCLDSIVSQTMLHREIEVIIVDDGSEDDTITKANLYEPLGWANFRILTQPNSGGPSTGRNRIIDEAQGEFIFFVDVDDYLGPDALKSMWDLAQADCADVVLGRFVGINGRGVPIHLFSETTTKTSMREKNLTNSMNVLKMFRTSFVRSFGYRFNTTLRMAEDHPFAMAAYANTERVAIMGDVDCYFAVRHRTPEGKKLHITGHLLPQHETYRRISEVFAVIASASVNDASLAAVAHAKYWERVLSIDIARDILRRPDKYEARKSINLALRTVNTYGAYQHFDILNPKAQLLLSSLNNRRASLIQQVARLVLSK